MKNVRFRYTGSWVDLDSESRRAIVERSVSPTESARADAAAIVDDVRRRGDTALRELAARFDGVELDALEVSRAALTKALNRIDPELRRALERAATNIAVVHGGFRPVTTSIEPEPGILITRRPDPIGRVGVYAPGGQASYPSSVLMTAVPARIAGVREIVLASPPGPSGAPSDAVLSAAVIAGVDRVFALGGAGAIAAFAYGTESVPRVNRIVGPGNAYVAAAKALVADRVAIDCPAGPSELVVIADDTTDMSFVAREMLAQAEHDAHAIVVTLVVGAPAAKKLAAALAAIPEPDRARTARAALEQYGALLTVADLAEAVRAANAIAPEHLLIAVDDAASLAAEVRDAGSVFLGASSSVVFGDYMTGANHVLPTGGAARSYSGLSPLDFVRWTTFQSVTPAAAAALATDVSLFALAEGLGAHATAAAAWSTS